MELSEFIIIYLACGAPFAVYRATAVGQRSHGPKWLGFVSAIAFWPFVAVGTVLAHLKAMRAGNESPLEDLRSRIEEIAFPDKQIQSVFEFREAFYRFVGLALARKIPQDTQIGNDKFVINELSPAPAAQFCLARRNRAKLERHFELAKDDFLYIIAEIAGSSSNAPMLHAMTNELAERVGVPILINNNTASTSDRTGTGLIPSENLSEIAIAARAGN